MKWVRDRTGRFAQRPHYEPEELNLECEALVISFLQARYGEAVFPISTDDLTVLIEQHVGNLDPYADLSSHGEDVEGVTDFVPNRQPSVRISNALSMNPRRENRFRTTLTHELGHVRFHGFLFKFADQQLSLLSESVAATAWRCKRETILAAREIDWMEWQAGYASGALLMPVTPLQGIVAALCKDAGVSTPLSLTTFAGADLIRRTQATFHVSAEAAQVRLIKLGCLSQAPPSPSLFDR